MDTVRMLVAVTLIAGVAAGGWWKRDALRQKLSGAEAAKPATVYSWGGRDGAPVFSDQKGSPAARRVDVDTSRIGRLEPVRPPPESASERRRPGPESAPGKGAVGAVKDPDRVKKEFYLQKLGREMQEKQLEIREKQMNAVIDGDTSQKR